jgi:hypothetical protein
MEQVSVDVVDKVNGSTTQSLLIGHGLLKLRSAPVGFAAVSRSSSSSAGFCALDFARYKTNLLRAAAEGM